MRFSAITAMCAAPVALAGTLQADLTARGAVALEARVPSQHTEGSKSKDTGSGGNGSGQSTSVDEVIVIWVNNGGGAATSTVTNTVTVTASGGVAAAAVATHQVTVGGSAGLVYSPSTIEAAVGDMVVFTFMSQNHTVTQSAFTTPCEALAGGQDSGFMANVNNTVSPPPQMAMQVTVATPIWFYCKQAGHCGKGMTFSINPTTNKTQAMFEQMAIAQNGTGAAAPIVGGSTTTIATAASATTAAAAAAATTATAAAAGTTGLASGTGTINSGGSCDCSCLCGVAAFPNAAVQGIGGFGGMSGSMPMSAIEA